MPDADVAQRRVLSMIPRDMDEGLRDAIHKGFGADEAVIGQHVGAHRHMLAAAETDLEMQRTIVAEQTLRAHFAAIPHSDARQPAVDPLLLPGHRKRVVYGKSV